jgi:hypothetical protein
MPKIVHRGNDAFRFIDEVPLGGMGVGYVNARLLAATWLMPGTRLLARDRHLNDVARRLRIALDVG